MLGGHICFLEYRLFPFLRGYMKLDRTCAAQRSSPKVELMYRRESLPDSYSLMDIAYIYTWKRNGPMRFYYRMPDIVQKQPLPPNDEVISDIPENVAETPSEPIKQDEIIPEKVEPAEKDELASNVADEKPSVTMKNSEGDLDINVEKQLLNDDTPEGNPTGINQEKRVEPKKPEMLEEKRISNENTHEAQEESTRPAQEEAHCSEDLRESILPNGIISHRPLSKQDELSVSVLLSLGNCVADKKEIAKTEDVISQPQSIQNTSSPETPKTSVESKKKILNGKVNPKFSVNKIASELAENNRLKEETKHFPTLAGASMNDVQQPITPQDTDRQSPKEEEKVKGGKGVNEKSDPFAFQSNENHSNLPISNGTSQHPQINNKVVNKHLTNKEGEPTVPPLRIILPKQSNHPRVEQVLTPKNDSPKRSSVSQMHSLNHSENSRGQKSDRPEVTVKTSSGSLTISTQPPIHSPYEKIEPHEFKVPQPNTNQTQTIEKRNISGKRLNGNGLVDIQYIKKDSDKYIKIQKSNINNRLPTFQKNIGRKPPVMPGGVMSKTGPTLDQRIQQLYQNKQNNKQSPAQTPLPNHHISPPGKQQESRLASWLNNRFPPQPKSISEGEQAPTKSQEKHEKSSVLKESEVSKLGKEMSMLKRKLDELRKTQGICEITQENPNPELVKKLRDVTPDVSIELMRASDMKNVEVTAKPKEKPVKRPVPALKSIQVDLGKRKSADEDKNMVKKPKIAGKKEEGALDLTGVKSPNEQPPRMALLQQNGRLPPQQHHMHWLMNRPLLANNHFLPRKT